MASRFRALPRFVILYAALYAGFGVASPFMPAFLQARGLTADQIGLVLGAGTAARLLAGPLAGRIADSTHAIRAVIAISASCAAVLLFGNLQLHSFWALFLGGMLLSAALAPSAPLADALALAAADHGAPKDRFEYGWVRGAGSAAFIMGVIGSGQAMQAFGFDAALMGQAVLLIATSLWLAIVPNRLKDRQTAISAAMPDKGSVCDLFRMPAFRWLIVVAALVLGSHALHDNFAIIRWTSAGVSTGTAGLLWSEQVVAEVAVFVFFGPALLSRLGPATALAVSATAGVVRWTVMGLSTQPVVLALVEPLHGLTFSLLHLAAMRVIEASVPAQMAATAQTIYGTVGVGASVALLTLLSGLLYQHLSGMAFWVMAGLCLAAIPLASKLKVATPCSRVSSTCSQG